MRRLAAALLAGAIASGAALVVPTLSAATSTPAAGRPWAPVKGIAINVTLAYNKTDAQAMAIGAQLFSMLSTQFHANAVSLNFPFYQSSSRANDPQRAPMTPSPGRLAMLTELAHRYHLSVQYRPYLWERNLVNQSRPSIDPSNVAVWFQHYWAFLEPYLESANEAGASSFSVALEFTTLLPHLSSWERLVHLARTVYQGELFYSQQHVPQETIPLTERGYDAYQPIVLKSDRQVSVAAFTKGFIQNFKMVGMQSTPGDLTAEEVGIPAVSGAYLQPNYFHYPSGTRVLRRVQADWFAGACNAFRALHMAGMYFWSIDFNTFTPAEDNTASIYNWLKTPSAAAIESCFARTP
ncbi:MAG TPA: hypothetical protein VGZ03_00585 [Acidimicrobiales bacterium]|jgi:hypothetical protein|nr:hypothetical protein [Acidimicrobiales bacterium]